MTKLLTCCGIGKFPVAPGTAGSLAAAIAAMLLLWLFGAAGWLMLGWLVLAASTTALYFLGEKAATAYIAKTGQEDPGLIVIDEWVGQMIAILSFMGLMWGSGQLQGSFARRAFKENSSMEALVVGGLIVGGLFLLFRVFDIVKPWHAGWADRELSGGRGVMLDDVFAGLYAGVSAAVLAWAVMVLV